MISNFERYNNSVSIQEALLIIDRLCLSCKDEFILADAERLKLWLLSK